MKILCVEDGSIDLDAIENEDMKDGKILVYKQGAKPPFVLDIPESKHYKEMWEYLKEDINNRIEYISKHPRIYDHTDQREINWVYLTKQTIDEVEKKFLIEKGE